MEWRWRGREVEWQLPKYGSYSKNLVMVRNEQPGRGGGRGRCYLRVRRRGGCNNRQIADPIYYPPTDPASIPHALSALRARDGAHISAVSWVHVAGIRRNLPQRRLARPPRQWSNGHKGSEWCSVVPLGEPRFVVRPAFSLLIASMKRICSWPPLPMPMASPPLGWAACPRGESSNAQILDEEREGKCSLCPDSCK